MTQILNLVRPDESQIKYKVSKFPDSQQSVTIDNSTGLSNRVIIQTRLCSFADLELLLCATQSLRGLFVKEISVYITYFLGARSDRKFEGGSCNYLKNVICPIINSQDYTAVAVLDPHSDVLEACLNNFVKISSQNYAKQFVDALYPKDKERNFVIVSPDAGALKKVYDIAAELDYSGNVVVASKHRDIKTGKILSTSVPLTGKHVNKDFIIFDDICDGGRTFIEIAKQIREQEFDGKIYLVVTHGIFSAGLSEISKWIDGVVCTNSYSDRTAELISDGAIDDSYIKIVKVI